MERAERGVKRPSQQVLAGLDGLDAAAVEAAAQAAKKQRISHYKKPDSSQSMHHHSSVPDSRNAQQQQQQVALARNSSSSSLKVRPSPPSHHQQQQQQQTQLNPYHNNHQPQQQQPAHQQQQHHHHRSDNQNYYRPGSLPLSTPAAVPVVSTRVTSSTDGPDTPNSSPDSMSTEHMMESDVTPASEEAEYTLQYQRIVSGEQRSRYKEDFNSQYNEYRNLHKAIDKVSKRFAQLEEELRQQHEGTTAWQVSEPH